MFDLKPHPLLEEGSRLKIMAALSMATEPMQFQTLAELLGMTAGNLSVHIRKLEDAGLLSVTKEFNGRKPLTTLRCSATGRKEVETYLEQVQKLLTKVSST